jgi:hypothetical protein
LLWAFYFVFTGTETVVVVVAVAFSTPGSGDLASRVKTLISAGASVSLAKFQRPSWDRLKTVGNARAPTAPVEKALINAESKDWSQALVVCVTFIS